MQAPDARQAQLTSHVYVNTGAVSNEIFLGAGWRQDDEDRSLDLPGPLVVAGRVQRELDLGTGRTAFDDETLASRTLRLKARVSWQ